MPVNTEHHLVKELIPLWQQIRDCLSPRRVKAAGARYLPKLKSHEKESGLYEAYKLRALFVPMTARTARAFVGLAFRRPPQVVVPDEALLENVTGTGHSFAQFARRVFDQVVAPGRMGILADMAPEQAGLPGDARAFLSEYHAECILDWHEETLGDLAARMPARAGVIWATELGISEGTVLPTQVRLKEYVDVHDPKDPFVIKRIEQIRSISLMPVGDSVGQVHELWRQRTAENGEALPGAEWIRVGEPIIPVRRGAPVPVIPFVAINQQSTELMPEEPALLGLSEINLSQYRTSADLENGRFKLGHPQLCVWGVEAGSLLEVGAGVWTSTNPQARAEVLQVADAFTALEKAMAEKDEQMIAEGARLISRHDRINETATAAVIRATGERSLLMSMTQTCAEGLQRALTYLAWWNAGTGTLQEMAKRVSVALNTDFEAQFLTGADAEAWLRVQLAGGLSKHALRDIYRRSGVYPEGWTDDQEAAAVEMDQVAAMRDLEDDDETPPPQMQ